MAVASPRTIFPITGWENDLKLIPPLSDEKVLKFYSTRSATDRCLDRSYNFHVESYVIPSSVRTNKCKQSAGVVFIKASCYRSKKKNSPPYSVIVAVNRLAEIIDGNCECPAGKLACNHLMGMLRTIQLMQSKGFSEAPEQLSCTDLPQQWKVPRKTSLKGCSIQAVDWRSVREGGLCTPKLARPKERRQHPRNEEQQEAAVQKFASRLLSLDPGNEFADGLLLTPLQPFKKTRYGYASAASPMAYQQALRPYGFAVHTAGILEAAGSSTATVPGLNFFSGASVWDPPPHVSGNLIVKLSIGT
ncbi:hypothetical protein MTO96_035435 [Rhipicephalus appendiculatus]